MDQRPGGWGQGSTEPPAVETGGSRAPVAPATGLLDPSHPSPNDATLRGQALIDRLLSEQQSLTAVERFSQWHEAGERSPRTGTKHRNRVPRSRHRSIPAFRISCLPLAPCSPPGTHWVASRSVSRASSGDAARRGAAICFRSGTGSLLRVQGVCGRMSHSQWVGCR
jgi:hypothetical protein